MLPCTNSLPEIVCICYSELYTSKVDCFSWFYRCNYFARFRQATHYRKLQFCWFILHSRASNCPYRVKQYRPNRCRKSPLSMNFEDGSLWPLANKSSLRMSAKYHHSWSCRVYCNFTVACWSIQMPVLFTPRSSKKNIFSGLSSFLPDVKLFNIFLY